MAIHTIIEINHDKAHVWFKDLKFGWNLYHALAGTLLKETAKQTLSYYGIKILNQHHSSKNFEVVEK